MYRYSDEQSDSDPHRDGYRSLLVVVRSEKVRVLKGTMRCTETLVTISTRTRKEHHPPNNAMDGVVAFIIRYARRTGISLAIYALSHLPVVGRFVLPAASFYTFNKAVGPKPAIAIFGSAIFLPRRYLIVFLQSYFSSRSLMRELVSVSTIHRQRTANIDNSLNRTSLGYASPRTKNGAGSEIGKVCFSGSPLASSSLSRFHCLECSFTASLRLVLHTSLPKSRSLLRLLRNKKTMRRRTSAGRTSMSSWLCPLQTWTL